MDRGFGVTEIEVFQGVNHWGSSNVLQRLMFPASLEVRDQLFSRAFCFVRPITQAPKTDLHHAINQL
jgi:hypothetical protein